jgi:hypothetical protein
MQNGGTKAVYFYCECKKVQLLRIWSHRTVECRSNQFTPRLSWLLGLEWNKYRKDLSQPHQAFKSQACHGGQKLFFSIHFLCPAFLLHSLHSHILLRLQESLNVVHLISSNTIQYRAPPLGITSTRDLIGWISLCMFTIYRSEKSTRKKLVGKTNQQGLETSYQLTKGPNLHHAQQSLTHLIQSSTKVNTDMQIRLHKSKHLYIWMRLT